MLENLPPEFFPSIAEIEQGFKDVQVECRTGRKLTVRMIMPPGRQALKVSADFLANPDLYKLILACLPEQDEAFLDRLTPQSIGELFNFSYVFVQGLEQAKKNWSVVQELKSAILGDPSWKPSSDSSGADSVPPKSAPGL